MFIISRETYFQSKFFFFYYTAPTIRTTVQNIPPLIPTQQPTILNIQQNVVNRQPVVSLQSNTSTPTSISYITTNQSSVNQTNWRTNQTDDKQQIANATFQNVQQQQTTQVNLISQSFKRKLKIADIHSMVSDQFINKKNF